MTNVFAGAREFNQPLDQWNVANVTTMRSMFVDARAFNQPLESWNVAKVTNMTFMFHNAKSFSFFNTLQQMWPLLKDHKPLNNIATG
jgi:surface protein